MKILKKIKKKIRETPTSPWPQFGAKFRPLGHLFCPSCPLLIPWNVHSVYFLNQRFQAILCGCTVLFVKPRFFLDPADIFIQYMEVGKLCSFENENLTLFENSNECKRSETDNQSFIDELPNFGSSK